MEDTPSDIDLILEAFSDAECAYDMEVVTDGESAIKRLLDVTRLPDLVLLDLNLPRLSGFEVLEQMKRHPIVRKVPVIIMTTSGDEYDVTNAYCRYANAYVKKSPAYEELVTSVRRMLEFWFRTARIPGYGSMPPAR